ncbi:hypothetical protein [Actinopolymorpha pittospori]|uniref:Uncharacterized protein n=1 Tax=Actinopolymorpha pittospori TaxID=648752 RepID=A0A927MYV0_9ACTN|nr:hypothetical protein [Actinopolymorpha pittospori]MBE1605680.1 hypothetical protein [Actinopolymorpha pittospori]
MKREIMLMIARSGTRSDGRRNRLEHVGHANDSGTLNHRESNTRRDWRPEVWSQGMKSDDGLRSGGEPFSNPRFESQRGVMHLVVDLGRERPARAVARGDRAFASTILCAEQPQSCPDVPVLALDRRPPVMLGPNVHTPIVARAHGPVTYISGSDTLGNTSIMTTRQDAEAAVRGLKIIGVSFMHDFIEVHIGDVTLTGYTRPFGVIGCQGIGPASLVRLIGKPVDHLTVVEGEYVAIDSGDNRLAFPIGGPSAKGPESVRLFRPGQVELDIPNAHWIW